MTTPSDSRDAPVPVHIDRSDTTEPNPTTVEYSVSYGGSKDGVGTILIAKPKGLHTLRILLYRLGVTPFELEIACRVIAEQAHHDIPDVKLSRIVLRELGHSST